jgi:hypothetical protein
MFGLGNFELWALVIACIVIGLPMIGIAVWILVTQVDWHAVKERRAQRKKLRNTHADAEQGG